MGAGTPEPRVSERTGSLELQTGGSRNRCSALTPDRALAVSTPSSHDSRA